MRIFTGAAAAALATVLYGTTALAASDADIAALKDELNSMKAAYENRIAQLENKLEQVERTQQKPQPAAAKASSGGAFDNRFNPSIGLVLNGTYGTFSEKTSGIAGFAVPGEGARKEESLKLGESELNFAASVDDKFSGGVTASFVNEDGEDGIEIEEAFVQTLPGTGLPAGMGIKAGRALWTLGYLNERHAHADDFADRPLPYRIFLNNAYNDDGVEVSYVLPTDFYSEIGGGVFRGDDYPFGSAAGSGADAWSAFARTGGDIAQDFAWRLGGTVLSGNSDGRLSNEDMVNFIGDTRLYVVDLRATWAPTGNPHEQEVLLQGEYFRRSEKGSYDDTALMTGPIAFNDNSNGWYAQGVYKFLPQWRAGYRYSRLSAPGVPAGLVGSLLDGGGHDPSAHALMADWSNSEFSRLRLQYNREDMAAGQADNQLLLQYIMSLGAHGAHKY